MLTVESSISPRYNCAPVHSLQLCIRPFTSILLNSGRIGSKDRVVGETDWIVDAIFTPADCVHLIVWYLR